MDITNPHTRKTELVAFVLSLLVPSIVAFFLVGGYAKSIRALDAERDILTNQIDGLTELSEHLAKGVESLGELEKDLDSLERSIPPSLDFNAFHQSLMEEAGRCNIIVTEVEPGDPSDGDGYLQMPISLTAMASFQDLHGFVFFLSSSPRLVTLEYFSLTLADTPGMCNVDMILKVYALKEASNDNAI